MDNKTLPSATDEADLDALVRRTVTFPDAPLSQVELHAAEVKLKRKCQIAAVAVALVPAATVATTLLGWVIVPAIGVFLCTLLAACISWAPVLRPLYSYHHAWEDRYAPIEAGALGTLVANSDGAPLARAHLASWVQQGLTIRAIDADQMLSSARAEARLRASIAKDAEAKSALLCKGSA